MILEFSEFIRKNYSYIIIATLLVSIVVGFYTAEPGKMLKAYSTLFVVLMIASMGFTITAKSLLLALKDGSILTTFQPKLLKQTKSVISFPA